MTRDENDYISLTDMAKHKNPEATGIVITHWMSTRYTVEFMGVWERLNNPEFNVTEFSNIRNESGSNGFVLSTKHWVKKTNAIGIYSKAGRYQSGTFAHKDIAFEFASWISSSNCTLSRNSNASKTRSKNSLAGTFGATLRKSTTESTPMPLSKTLFPRN